MHTTVFNVIVEIGIGDFNFLTTSIDGIEEVDNLAPNIFKVIIGEGWSNNVALEREGLVNEMVLVEILDHLWKRELLGAHADVSKLALKCYHKIHVLLQEY